MQRKRNIPYRCWKAMRKAHSPWLRAETSVFFCARTQLDLKTCSESLEVLSLLLQSGAGESLRTTAVSFRYDFIILSWPPNMLRPWPFSPTDWDHVANNVFGINLNSSGLNLITLCKLENIPSRLGGNSFCVWLQSSVLVKLLAFWQIYSEGRGQSVIKN